MYGCASDASAIYKATEMLLQRAQPGQQHFSGITGTCVL